MIPVMVRPMESDEASQVAAFIQQQCYPDADEKFCCGWIRQFLPTEDDRFCKVLVALEGNDLVGAVVVGIQDLAKRYKLQLAFDTYWLVVRDETIKQILFGRARSVQFLD